MGVTKSSENCSEKSICKSYPKSAKGLPCALREKTSRNQCHFEVVSSAAMSPLDAFVMMRCGSHGNQINTDINRKGSSSGSHDNRDRSNSDLEHRNKMSDVETDRPRGLVVESEEIPLNGSIRILLVVYKTYIWTNIILSHLDQQRI